jgi:nicotinamidase-related amidase
LSLQLRPARPVRLSGKLPDRYTEPQFDSVALITIDTQRDVLDDGPFPIPGTTAVLPAITRLLEAFRAASRPIVHIVRLYEPDGSNAEPARRAALEGGLQILAPGTPGSELAPALLPEPDLSLDPDELLSRGIQRLTDHETVMYKPRWGAFYETPLEQHLRRHHISTLVFSGCNYPNCPRTSIYEASERDFRTVLATDAISGLYERGERELESIGVTLMTADEIAYAIPRRTATARH